MYIYSSLFIFLLSPYKIFSLSIIYLSINKVYFLSIIDFSSSWLKSAQDNILVYMINYKKLQFNNNMFTVILKPAITDNYIFYFKMSCSAYLLFSSDV